MAYENLNLKDKKYFIVVKENGSSTRQFKNCDYHYYHDQNILSITTSENVKIEFIGNFSASIISMEDYAKATTIHD